MNRSGYAHAHKKRCIGEPRFHQLVNVGVFIVRFRRCSTGSS